MLTVVAPGVLCQIRVVRCASPTIDIEVPSTEAEHTMLAYHHWIVSNAVHIDVVLSSAAQQDIACPFLLLLILLLTCAVLRPPCFQCDIGQWETPSCVVELARDPRGGICAFSCMCLGMVCALWFRLQGYDAIGHCLLCLQPVAAGPLLAYITLHYTR